MLKPAPGSTRERKRVGRGNASGKGTTAGKGQKGQKARSGKPNHPGFEGGQFPLYRRLARKRGFVNPNRVEYEVVNLSDLAELPADSVVTPESLQAAGLIRHPRKPVKILAVGELSAALTVRAHAFSAAARQKIEMAGGRVEDPDGNPIARAEESDGNAVSAE